MSRRRWHVEWTAAARRDLAAILRYVFERSPEAAARLMSVLEARAAGLETLPPRGRIVPELLRLQVREYRELVVPPHRILYRVNGSRVLVLAVFDARRHLEDVILDRLLGD